MLALLDEGEGLDTEDIRRLKVMNKEGKEGRRKGGREEGPEEEATLLVLTYIHSNHVHTQAINPAILVRLHTRALATAAV